MKLQAALCPKCGRIKGVEKKSKIRKQTINSTTICQTCRQEALAAMAQRSRSLELRQKNSIRMKKYNPMYEAVVRAKAAATATGKETNVEEYLAIKKHKRKETKEETSERMKNHNPMFDPDVKKKSMQTKKDRLANGEIVYKRGQEHHLWRGNRDFNNSCRSNLYTVWVKEVLRRDKFTCQVCGSEENLQVHHKKPLREFIQIVKDKYSIKTFVDISSELWQPYIDEIIEMHSLDDGITVCRRCHSEIDEQYRGYTDEDQKH